MTDRQLLEDAAKAAGIVLKFDVDDPIMVLSDDSGPIYRDWNPLTSDGDALRLAVQLGISIEYVGDDDGKIIGSTTNGHEFECVDAANPCAATRRAITRAAAEIGRAMP